MCWIMLSDCFLSIVFKDCAADELLVRARRRNDIGRVFPDAKVTKDTKADYLYRAVIPKAAVMAAIGAQIEAIDYPNFKETVKNDLLHRCYLNVWWILSELQPPNPFKSHRGGGLRSAGKRMKETC
jgi:hypothetical protein